MKKVYIETGLCELRLLDSENITKYLTLNGHAIVNNPKDADIIIFNTCAVLDKITEEALKKIKKFQKYDAELIVAGCLPGTDPDKLSKVFNGKVIITKDIEKIDSFFPENKIKYTEIGESNTPTLPTRILDFAGPLGLIIKKFTKIKSIDYLTKIAIERTLKRFFGIRSVIYKSMTKDFFMIRIAWGCVSNCAYCNIKNAIGPLKSRPIDQCLREFQDGLDRGYKDFILAGDNIGAYGLDIDSSFPEILDKVTDIQGDYDILLRFIDPRWSIKYADSFEKILKKNKISTVDICIQSGSSRILKLMNRYHDVKMMKDTILRLKNSVPNLEVYTHIIIGFPTETEEDFKQSLNFIKEVDFGSGFIHPFSLKTGSKAEEIEPKISQKEIWKRMKYARKYLRNLGYRVSYVSAQGFIVFGGRKY